MKLQLVAHFVFVLQCRPAKFCYFRTTQQLSYAQAHILQIKCSETNILELTRNYLLIINFLVEIRLRSRTLLRTFVFTNLPWRCVFFAQVATSNWVMSARHFHDGLLVDGGCRCHHPWPVRSGHLQGLWIEKQDSSAEPTSLKLAGFADVHPRMNPKFGDWLGALITYPVFCLFSVFCCCFCIT